MEADPPHIQTLVRCTLAVALPPRGGKTMKVHPVSLEGWRHRPRLASTRRSVLVVPATTLFEQPMADGTTTLWCPVRAMMRRDAIVLVTVPITGKSIWVEASSLHQGKYMLRGKPVIGAPPILRGGLAL